MKIKEETQQLNMSLIGDNVYAKCCFNECTYKAEWSMGTWQCCDKCAKKWIIETERGYGFSPWGTSSRIGQDAILKHNIQFNLKHYLISN
jgi:hypothetical protein